MRAAFVTEIVVAEKPTTSGRKARILAATSPTVQPPALASTIATSWPSRRATAAITSMPIPGIDSSFSRSRSMARSQKT